MLAPAAVEQLDRDDVGEGIDKPAVEDRTLVGCLTPGAPHLRQQEPDDCRIAGEPQGNDDTHHRIERHQDGDGQDDEGQERPHRLQDVDDEVADRLASLHDLGGDTAGEVVLVEAVGLLDHPAECLPAHHRIEAGHHDLLLDDRRGDHDDRADNKDEEQQPDQCRPMVGEQRGGRGTVEQIDQPADRPVHRRIDGAGEPAGDEQQEEGALRLVGEIKDEAPRILGQHLTIRVVKRIDGALHRAPHAITEPFVAHASSFLNRCIKDLNQPFRCQA